MGLDRGSWTIAHDSKRSGHGQSRAVGLQIEPCPISSLAVTLIAALGCGAVAGAFFAFSTFVMGALTRLPTPHGIAAMQSINRQGSVHRS